MKKRSRKLERIVSLACSEEQSLRERAGQARKKLEKQRERLGELNAFRQNYKSKAAQSEPIRSAHLEDYKHFQKRLDDAVGSQRQVIQDSERNYETVRRRWIVKRQRRESLERVLDKYRRAEAAHEGRLEQKKIDDLRPSREPFTAESDD